MILNQSFYFGLSSGVAGVRKRIKLTHNKTLAENNIETAIQSKKKTFKGWVHKLI